MTAIIGLSGQTAQSLTGQEHLIQSIRDILTTRQGSRRMRPEYGSNLPLMVDLPMNAGWISAAQAEIAGALGRWEPRIRITRVTVDALVEGRVAMRIQGEYQGDSIVLQVTA